MKKRELKLAVRTAARIAREREFYLIGSQAIHAACSDPPAEVLEIGLNSPKWREMLAHGPFEHLHKLWIHELVIIRNVQADHRFPLHGFGKLLLQTFHVLFLHAKNGVCPAQQALGHFDPSLGFRAGGFHRKAWRTPENPFGSEAAAFIAAANKEKLRHSDRISFLA
jgi:hypothetical protein